MEELKDTIKKSGAGISDEELDRIISELDSDNNQKINYSEFLAASIDIA